MKRCFLYKGGVLKADRTSQAARVSVARKGEAAGFQLQSAESSATLSTGKLVLVFLAPEL